MQPVILKNRADFVSAARARRTSRPGFTLQARQRQDDIEPGVVRVGFTCSKKVGNAVARNRAKRRLRSIAREVLPDAGLPGWDYVLIGRPEITASRDYAVMRSELHSAVKAVHAPRKSRS